MPTENQKSVEIVAGDFELDRAKLLGKGAWGEVFIGRQVSLNRPVAIKILKKELTADPDFVRRFRREAECLAQLAEEHIIQVYALGEYQGSPYFIMEFVQGVSLAECMKNNRIFSIEDITHVAVSVTKAFKAAWNSPAKIVHRDIKPANIMVSFTSSIISPSPEKAEKSASLMSSTINIKDAQVKVMDFGLAKLALSGDGDHEATMVGTVIGTPKYISPEQGMGNAADIRSDIYSLGIVLYEMATGKIPFEGESAMSMIRHHIYDTAMMISQNMADFPPALEAIVMKCIEKAPEKRYQTPTELLEDMDAFEKNKPLVHATIDPDRAAAAGLDATMLAPGSAVRRKGRQKIMIVSGAVAGIALLASLAFWQPWKEPPPAPPDNSGVIAPAVEPSVPEDPFIKELEALMAEAKELDSQDKWSEAMGKLAEVIEKKEDYEPALALIKEIEGKIEAHREKIRLVDAMVADTLTDIGEFKTPDQRTFNLGVENLGKKRFKAFRDEVVKWIDRQDPDISPAAIYLQMRIWMLSLEGNYIDEMDTLMDKLKGFYDDSPLVSKAEELLKSAQAKKDEMAVDNIINAGLKELNLDKRVNMFKNFISANPDNQFIVRVKEKLDDTVAEIENVRATNYGMAIGQARRQLADKLFQNAYDTLKGARQYVNDNDFTEIDALKSEIEKAFLAHQGIEPASGPFGSQAMVFAAITNTKDGAALVLVPAGEFTRGYDKGGPEEQPAGLVRLDAFYADAFEITNEQFRRFIKETGYKTDAEVEGFGWVDNDGVLEPVKGACWSDPKGANQGVEAILNHPVVQVSWNDAWNYAKWAGKRLMTEAEWEKAARSDKAILYPWGAEKYQPRAANIGEDGNWKTAPVGSYEKDRGPYGCFDLAGNVAEWCADWHDAFYYQKSSGENHKGPAGGSYRVIRGGSWLSSASSARLTLRRYGFSPPHEKSPNKDQTRFWSDYLGFRCARDVVTLK